MVDFKKRLAGNYLVWESKNEVSLDRAEISKYETDQMNSSAAWFEKHYPGATPKYIEIHPASVVSSASAFRVPVGVMREKELTRFARAVRAFFKSFQALDFKDLSLPHIHNLLVEHGLGQSLMQLIACACSLHCCRWTM